MFPVPPAVGRAFSIELDVEDGEVENYEVGMKTTTIFKELNYKLCFQSCFWLSRKYNNCKDKIQRSSSCLFVVLDI